jgi:protein-disulfide isomerase
MSTVVNENYPKKNEQLSDDQIKALVVNEANIQQTNTSNIPTEVIDLPSKGWFYPEGHPLASGKIEMKYMTAKEEDILASQNLIKQGVVIDKLLQSLIITRFNYNDLLTIDKNAVFIAARILAYGPSYDVEITCPNCGEKSKHSINLQEFEEKQIDWSKFTKGQTTHKFTLPASKQVLELKFLTHGDEKTIEENVKANKKLSKILGVDPELTTRLKQLIVSYNGVTDIREISKMVDNMLSRDSLALRTHLKEITPDIDTTFSFTCPHCDFVQEKMALPINVSFFWPSL